MYPIPLDIAPIPYPVHIAIAPIPSFEAFGALTADLSVAFAMARRRGGREPRAHSTRPSTPHARGSRNST